MLLWIARHDPRVILGSAALALFIAGFITGRYT